VIVFWTRHPRPLFPYLDELDRRGYRYYFQYTLLGYPRQIDPKSPSQSAAIETFRELAERLGPERLIWRYDPIVFSQATGIEYHAEHYAQIAAALRGCTFRSVVSVVDLYAKTHKRLATQGVVSNEADGRSEPHFAGLLRGLAHAASENGMQIQSCAEELDWTVYGIQPGKCIDDGYIRATFGIEVGHCKDPSQRKACGCVVSKDIGMYDSCLFGCSYCYATGSFEHARENYEKHDPDSPALLGWVGDELSYHEAAQARKTST